MDITKHPAQTPPTQPRFTVLIPTWNNLKYLQNAVRSLRLHSAFAHQIVVHINEGNDGTREWVAAQQDLDYTLSAMNVGICEAVNVAATLAKTDYLVYFNDDMYALPNWDAQLWQHIERIGHTAFYLSATMIEPTDTGNSCVIVADYGNNLANFAEAELLKNYQKPSKMDWSGATWPPSVVHRDYWDRVGGYSIEFSPGMYSDPDFSRKLWAAGVRTFVGIGASRIYHFGKKSTKRVRRNTGRETFIKKWGISANVFMHRYLRIGQLHTENTTLNEPFFNNWQKIRNFWTRKKAQ
jgi:glycosyltransferase involved in cell wall biosynthesis